jgi:hypothetical protein
MENFLFWDTAQCRPLKIKSSFGGSFACYLLHARFLHELFLDPEDEDNMFLGNFG